MGEKERPGRGRNKKDEWKDAGSFRLPFSNMPAEDKKPKDPLGDKEIPAKEKIPENPQLKQTLAEKPDENLNNPDKKKLKLPSEELKKEWVRMAADYTYDKMAEKDINDLHTETAEESDKIFIEKTRQLWKEFAVHGRAVSDEKGNLTINTENSETDLDGQAFLKLLKLAGFDTRDVKYQGHGEWRVGGVTGDSSNRHGVVTPDGGKSLIIDHHAKESKRDSSTAKFTYEMLVKFGLLKEDENLQKFVDLVTAEDNKNYSEDEIRDLFNPKTRKYARTVAGLARYLDADAIFELLKNVKDHKEELPRNLLDTFKVKDSFTGEEKTLREFSEKMKERMRISERNIGQMSGAGFEAGSEGGLFGKILIDTGVMRIADANRKEGYINKVAEGNMAAWAAGYGAYVVWIPEQNRFKIFTQKPLGDVSFSQGLNVRGNFWNKPGDDGKKLEVTLEEILTKLCGKETKIDGKLKEAIEKEQKTREKMRAEVEGVRELVEHLGKEFQPDKFDEKVYGEKISRKAQELGTELKEAADGEVGAKKKFADWSQKRAALEKIKGKMDRFFKQAKEAKEKEEEREKEKSAEKRELSETEKLYLERVYVQFAKEYLEGIKKHYSEENGYKPKGLAIKIKKREDDFWEQELLAIISEDGRIREENISIAVEEIRKRV